MLYQWPHVCGLNPAPSDEPTSQGMSAEGSLRRAIVPPFQPAVSVDEGHSRPGHLPTNGRQLLDLNGERLHIAFGEIYFPNGNIISSRR